MNKRTDLTSTRCSIGDIATFAEAVGIKAELKAEGFTRVGIYEQSGPDLSSCTGLFCVDARGKRNHSKGN